MSWWVGLTAPEPLAVTAHTEGGMFVLGGSDEPSLNITYNYGGLFREALHDPTPKEPNVLGRLLDGKRAGDVIDLLRQAVATLGTERSEDYWDETRGNAGHALSILLEWAEQYPDAEFYVH